jgi:predicted ABC-class ATPase
MQALVQRETIFPLIDRVRELHAELGVSTVIVIGGSGDWLEVADTVVLMEAFVPHEVSARAREVVASTPTGRATPSERPPVRIDGRVPRVRSLDPDRGGRGRAKVRARGLRELRYGEETVDLSALEQLVDDSQARAVGVLLQWIGRHGVAGRTLAQHLDDVLEVAARRGLYDLEPLPELAAVRRFELAGALNRLRSLEVGNETSAGVVPEDSR